MLRKLSTLRSSNGPNIRDQKLAIIRSTAFVNKSLMKLLNPSNGQQRNRSPRNRKIAKKIVKKIVKKIAKKIVKKIVKKGLKKQRLRLNLL